MNPSQYKLALERRALERREVFTQHQLQRVASKPQPSSRAAFAAPQPTSTTAGAKLEREGAVLAIGESGIVEHERLRLDGRGVKSGGDGGHLAIEVGYHLHEEGSSVPEPISPLAPDPLSHLWPNDLAQTRGFDQQGGVLDYRDKRTDTWDSGIDDEHSGSDGGECEEWLDEEEIVVADWGRRPGDTSITYAARLYLSNLNPDCSHEVNCERLLRQILERVALEELGVQALKMRHHVKIEAFLRSVVLSVPSQTWQQSVVGAFALTSPTRSRGNEGKAFGNAQQISREEMMFRMAFFAAMMAAESKGTEEASCAVDPMRVEGVLRGYAANAAHILPLQRPARRLLPPLLLCMACELLGVRLLGPEVRDVCRQIASDYEARAKLWMSPAQNAERFLRPLVTEFASWLRCNRDVLYQESATEGLLRSIDDRLRRRLKSQVYQSPEHFLAVLESLKEHLTDTPLPSYDPSGGDDDHPFDVSQTLKDVRREKFHVNRVPTAPDQCWAVIRALLYTAAVTAARTSEDKWFTTATCPGENLSVDSSGGRLSGHQPEPREAGIDDQGPTGGEVTATLRATSTCDATMGAVPTAMVNAPGFPCGDAAAGNGGRPCGEIGTGERDKAEARFRGRAGAGEAGREMVRSGLDMYVDQCAWRVLHAASRTATGGDSFFVVQDLFGGEGVLVKTATAPTEPIKIRTNGMAVRVTTVDNYDIYHASDVDMSESSPLPLISITTSIKEVIQFATYRDSNALPRRQSEVFAAGPASDSPEEAANMQPDHALSGRFITISAHLPDHRMGHLDASVGVLRAPDGIESSTDQSTENAAETSQKSETPVPCTAPVSPTSTSARKESSQSNYRPPGGTQMMSSGTSRLRKSLSEPSLNHDGIVARRPSMFRAPPVESLPNGWKDSRGSGN